jgi:hypothetical protein
MYSTIRKDYDIIIKNANDIGLTFEERDGKFFIFSQGKQLGKFDTLKQVNFFIYKYVFGYCCLEEK